jgi:polysaccharide biosynthesis transport protein
MKKLLLPGRDGEPIEIASLGIDEEASITGDNYYGANNHSFERQIFTKTLTTLRNHWLLIVLLTSVITFAALFYAAQKPDYYQARARVQVNAEINPAAGGGEKGSAIIVSNPGSDPAYFTTQLQIIEGTELLRRVAKTLDLENSSDFLDPQHGKQLTAFQNVQKMLGLYKIPKENEPAKPARQITKNTLKLRSDPIIDPDLETQKYAPLVQGIKSDLSVLPVKDSRTNNRETRLIEIEYTHQDPAVAAKIVNAIGDAYVLQNLERKVQTNASSSDFMQKRVAELQSEIRQGEERLINYSKDNQIVSLDANQNTVVQRFSDLNQKLGEAENDRIAAQSAYQAARQNEMRAATAEGKDAQVSGLEGKLNDLRQKLAQLKTQYTDEWFEVVETRKQIDSIENQLAVIRKRASDVQIATLQERLNETVAREKELRDNFAAQRAEVMRQNEASINYKIIQQEVDTNKNLLAGLLQRSRENDVILNGTPNNVLVAERALIPQNPIGPQRAKTVLLAFIVSLFAGSCLAFVLDWFNDSVKTSEDLEATLGLPVLTPIPAAPVHLSERLLPSVAAFTRRKSVKNYNLEAFDKPEFAEAYFQLSARLRYSAAGAAPQTILIASAVEGEGKTLTALNLAQSLAKTGEKVLLIDADLRCPRLHFIKNLHNDKGLTTLLGISDLNDQFIEDAIQKSEGSSLYFLTAGESSLNPSNLLCSDEMRGLLARLSEKYTRIIIDSPPTLYFADSMILATMVSAVVLVVRNHLSSHRSILKAKKILVSAGANLVGIVYNGIPVEWGTANIYRRYQPPKQLPPSSGFELLKLD